MTERDYVKCKTILQTWLGGQAENLLESKETTFEVRVMMAAVKVFELTGALEHIADHPDWMCYAHTGDDHEGDCAVATARKALKRWKGGD